MSNYNPRITSLSPQIWFKFDESSGTPTNSGLSTNCAISTTAGSPTLNQIGLINKSVLFDGNDGYRLDTGSLNSNVFGDGTFSVEAWVKTSSSAGIQEIFQMGVSTNSNSTFDAGWALRLNLGRPQFYYIGKASTTFTELTHGSTISDGNWHHLVGTVKTTSGNYDIKLYLDGTLIQSDLANSTTAPGSNADGVAYSWKRIAQSINNDEYFIGNIEELAIYSTELTATNVLDTYNVGSYKFGKAYDHWVSTTQSSNNAWQYHYTNNTRTTATLYSAYSTSGNELVTNEPQWDNNQNYLSNYPYVQRVTAPNTSTPSGEFRNSFNSTPNLLLHPSDKTPNQYTAVAWKNTTGASVTVSGTVTLKLANPTNNFDGIDWWFQRELVNGANYSLLSNGNIDNGVSSTSTYNFSNVTVASGDRLFLIVGNYEFYNYDATIVTFEVNRVASIAADPSTASTLMVDPAVSTVRNIDINGGGVSTASALAVDPIATTTKNINYAADPSTASATSPNATASTTRFLDYAASPATASALLSSNFYGGNTGQDTTYTLTLREMQTDTGSNISANNGFSIGRNKSGIITLNEKQLLLIPTTGIPDRNKLVKVKFNSAHLGITTTSDIAPNNRFNIYKITQTITDATTVQASNISKTLLYTTRLLDDSTTGNSNFYLDLTPAFTDTSAYTNGIVIQSVNDGTSYNGWDETIFTGSNLQHELLYILSADVLNKNVNADAMTASSLATDATVFIQAYVNVFADPSTASTDIVDPTAGFSTGFNAAPATASGEAIQPTFNRTVEYPHVYAEAFATTVTPTLFIEGSNNYAAAPATASADLHMPQYDIGENNSADHMDASALFVMPTLIIPRVVDAMTTTASALMVQPTSTLQLLGAVTASPMTATTDIITPPSYVNLFTDKWYNTLFTQHSRLHGVRIPLSNETGEAILKRFDDVVTPKLIGSTVVNSLSAKIITDSINGDATIGSPMNIIGEFNNTANPAVITPGFFDPYGRKAVRLNNITTGYENSLSFTPEFTFEMSIKTTKADQIIAFGRWAATNGNQRRATVLGISDGKLFVNSTQVIGVAPMLHYKELADPNKQYAVIGNNSIADGEWHHIVVQYGFGDSRVQFWIDGKLDIQRFTDRLEGLNFLGHNASTSTYASDFYTSAWSYDANAFISEQEISDHNLAYTNVEPVRAEPMTANITATSGNNAKGNRGRALMLYWWPTSMGQNQNLITSRFDTLTHGSGEFDINMSANELETIDYINQPPQQYYGWDVFPVDINGYYVSDLVKEEAYGGKDNIIEQTRSIAFTGQNYSLPKFKINRGGYFRDKLTDTARYIDLVNDIDLSQFDVIFFKNYPDQSAEIDEFAKNQIVDRYFNVRETAIYEKFIKGLRAAVDTGISLMINNPQLALDLKIIDRIEIVPDLVDGEGYYSDVYTPTIVPEQYEVSIGETSNLWTDTYRNNRIRILNTLQRLTDYRSIIYTDAALWTNDDTIEYGGANRPFRGFQYRPDGLSVGDEFFISTFLFGNPQLGGGGSIGRNYLATPIANVKAGTPITAFANQYRKGLDLVDNPYKNHVTTIAIKPGDVLDGKQVGGKIWVNFTDAINNEQDYAAIDAIHTDWINRAYNEGAITLSKRNELLASPNLLENQLSSGKITQQQYNKLILWQSNGSYILTQTNQISEEVASKPSDGGGFEKVVTRKFNKDGAPSTQITYVTGPQFFTFKYARQYEQLIFENASMNTRGLRWLSSRVEAVAQTQAHTAMPASATMIQPVVVGNKQNNITVQPMLANATKVPAVGFAGADRNIISLPLEASANIVQPVKKVSAEPMTVSAAFREQVVIRTTAQDQVVVYVLHEDPILYLREDIIK